MTLEDMVRVVAHVASGLDALHAGGIVHRDVKPSNVIIDETGSANLTDFGLAKGRAYTVLTKPGMVMGTLDYLAPELLRGSEATGASDIYALGCLAYECTAGRAVRGHVDVRPCERAPERRAPTRARTAPTRRRAVVGDPAGAGQGPRQAPSNTTAYAHLISFAIGTRESSPPPSPPPPP